MLLFQVAPSCFRFTAPLNFTKDLFLLKHVMLANTTTTLSLIGLKRTSTEICFPWLPTRRSKHPVLNIYRNEFVDTYFSLSYVVGSQQGNPEKPLKTFLE